MIRTMRWWGAAAALASFALGCLESPPDQRSGDPTPDAALGGSTDGGGSGDGGGTSDAGVVCEQPPPPTGGDCGPPCDDCAANVCTVDCQAPPGCGGTINCPEGFDCQIDCLDNDSCIGVTINCPSVHECHLTCAGDDACMGLTLNCLDGPCYINCIGDPQACRTTYVNCGTGECSAYCPNEGSSLPSVVCGSSCQCTRC